MAKFTIDFTTGASQTVTVEADDLDEALDKAYDELDTGLCWSCSSKANLGDFEASGYFDPEDGEYKELMP